MGGSSVVGSSSSLSPQGLECAKRLTHRAGSYDLAGILAGAIDWSASLFFFMWPLHVAWGSHNMVAGFQQEEGGSCQSS